MKKNKSLTQSAYTVNITLPRIACDYDPVMNIHTWLVSWGEAEKQLQWTNDYFRYNPEKIAEAINEALAELCKIAVPYKLIPPSNPS